MHYGFALTSYLAYRFFNKNSALFVLNDNFEAKNFYEALIFFNNYYKKNSTVDFFESYTIGARSSIMPSSEVIKNRLSVLANLLLQSDKQQFVVSSLEACIQPTVKEDKFTLYKVEKNQKVNMKTFINFLLDFYYEKVTNVEEIGQFATRGSIVDCFVPTYDKPMRFDFFGDVIDDIRFFYPTNQTTYSKTDKVYITRAREYKYLEDEFGFSLIDEKDKGYLLDYTIKRNFDRYCFFDARSSDSVLNKVYTQDKDLFDLRILNEKRIDRLEYLNNFESNFIPGSTVSEKLDHLVRLSKSQKVVIACAGEYKAKKLKDILTQKKAVFNDHNGIGIFLDNGYIKVGFRLDDIAFISFEEIFGVSIKKDQDIVSSTTFSSFQKDGLVAHKQYGIGIYRGIKAIKVEDALMDFFEIEYANNDKVYVPVVAVDNLYKYSGQAEIDSLKSKSWGRRKENASKSIKKILTELVNVYAKRRIIHRKPYDVDLIEYKEFEAEFEYEETKDQLQAILDIKDDMQQDAPMERLICGDVSFGKTEVAMRAIAIAAFNESQSALIAPTTILSLQHYNTLCDRFENFPVNIALLNSFTKKNEREKILNELSSGKIDILIATHSVYSASVKFYNLGLVVVDEEQHFGVKIKEYFKQQYENIDMLYLSATPIPRTLNMAINSIMGISIIKTAPLSRKKIETFVIKYNDRIIKEALERELARQGSVFIIHNRIETIDNIKKRLDEILPGYEKRIIHSKLAKNEIKKNITDFANGRFPILISTAIIESGLDLKHVNTIIILQAQNFGLSDLYQLRGRVGRSDIEAYAYLLYDVDLTEKAQERLNTLKNFMERGFGFNIALKDLEIRGAGNILGKDQSGNIKAIGYDLYVELTSEALSQMTNNYVERDVEIRFIDNLYIPSWYIDDEKTTIYTLISKAKTEEELLDIKQYIEDKYGKFPKVVSTLIDINIIKIYAKRAFVKQLMFGPKGVSIQFYIDAKIDSDKLIKEVNLLKGKFLSETAVFLNINKGELNILKNFLINLV